MNIVLWVLFIACSVIVIYILRSIIMPRIYIYKWRKQLNNDAEKER